MFFFYPNSNNFTQEYEIENELFRLLSFKFFFNDSVFFDEKEL